MANTTYSKNLQHPNWQKKRLEILNRDNFICKLCGDTETTLHIHHLKYIDFNKPENINNDYLITYCEDCHRIVENIKKANTFEINVIKIKKVRHHKYPLVDESQLWVFCENEEDRFIFRFYKKNGEMDCQFLIYEFELKRLTEIFSEI